MTKVWTIARYNLLRMFRERANLFFVLVFPILVIAILGSQFGGDDVSEVGVAGEGEFVDAAVERLENTGAAEVRRVGPQELRDLVEQETLPVGVAVPDDAEQVLLDGERLRLTVVLGSGDDAAQLEGLVTRAFEAQAVVPGVTGRLAQSGGDPVESVADMVGAVAERLPGVEVEQVLAGGGEPEEEAFGFNQIAIGMLLLMTFLNSLTGAAALIQSRRLGVSRRMLASPTGAGTIIFGEGAGRWAVGMFQAVYIMVATALLFDVTWGDLPTAVVVLALFAAVAAGAAMLVGAVMHNDEQASGVTVMVGLGLGALGGTMLPLELFGSTMRAVAHITPHAWAIDALTEVGRDGGTLTDILPELGVLAAAAAVLIGLAGWRLRLTLTS